MTNTLQEELIFLQSLNKWRTKLTRPKKFVYGSYNYKYNKFDINFKKLFNSQIILGKNYNKQLKQDKRLLNYIYYMCNNVPYEEVNGILEVIGNNYEPCDIDHGTYITRDKCNIVFIDSKYKFVQVIYKQVNNIVQITNILVITRVKQTNKKVKVRKLWCYNTYSKMLITNKKYL